MKTKSFPKLLPPLPPEEEGHESNLWLKAYFCGCALQGHLASENGDGAGWLHTDEYVITHAYDLGSMMYEIFVEENPTVVRNFNRKVGL
jgi:hypothetical protein